jgi:hypothetical protein
MFLREQFVSGTAEMQTQANSRICTLKHIMTDAGKLSPNI